MKKKYEVRRNDPIDEGRFNSVLVGYADHDDEIEELIKHDRWGHQSMMLFGTVAYTVTKTKHDPKPSTGSGQRNRS